MTWDLSCPLQKCFSSTSKRICRVPEDVSLVFESSRVCVVYIKKLPWVGGIHSVVDLCTRGPGFDLTTEKKETKNPPEGFSEIYV
jgi:hypothetical protein